MTEAAAPRTPTTVLVVEDEALIAMLLADMLADAGYHPVCRTDGHDGPGSAESGSSDLQAAVVDLNLGRGLDGRRVIRSLRARRPAMPVVVITGYHPRSPQADLRGLGGPTLRLGKPIDRDALVDGVAAVLNVPANPATPRRRVSDAALPPA